MLPESYEEIGKKFTEYEFKPGVSLKLKQKKATAVISTDELLANPAFDAKFKVKKAGKFQVGFAEGKPAITLEPKFNKIKSELVINPLENTFVFSMKRKLKKMKSKVVVGFDSAEQAPSLELIPKFKVNGIKINANLLFKKPVEGCPPVIFTGQARVKKVQFCTCFNEEEKEYRAAAFAKIAKKIHAGALFHFQPEQEKILKAVDIFTKAKHKGHKAAVIATVLGESPVVKFNAKGKFSKQCKYGLNAVYNKDINADFGIKADLKKMDLRLILKAAKEAEKPITTGLIGQAKFKVKKIGKAKVGLSIPTIAESKEINYFVNLKVKD